jgi:hypothetical protein
MVAQRDGRRHARHGALDPRGVALARDVLDQPRVARAEDVRGAVAEADLELAGEDDDELAPRRGVPVDEVAHRALAERDLGGVEALGPLGRARDVDGLDVRVAVGTGIEAERSHRVLPEQVW